MFVLISPAKHLNFDPAKFELARTQPQLAADTKALLKRTKKLSRADLKRLMKISDNLADLNYERFQALSTGLSDEHAKEAILAFNGDVYRGLDAASLSETDLNWSQDHLRILSGLYGVLKPLDAIHPYRLEMGSRLDTSRGKNLYEFWGSKISQTLNVDMDGDVRPVLNLASNEYFSAVDKKALKSPVFDVVFKEEKDGDSKVLSFYAKFARGLMARWIIQNRITDIPSLKTFNLEGYVFNAGASTEKEFVFTRPQPSPKR